MRLFHKPLPSYVFTYIIATMEKRIYKHTSSISKWYMVASIMIKKKLKLKIESTIYYLYIFAAIVRKVLG